MNRFVSSAFVLVLLIGLNGCGESKFDVNNPRTLDKMMAGMSLEEQVMFIKDAELVAKALSGGAPGGEYKLNGYTVEQIREEAKNVRDFLNKKNIAFLKEIISEMESTGRTTIALHVSDNGVFSSPEEGYIPKEYSIDYLKKMLSKLSPVDNRGA